MDEIHPAATIFPMMSDDELNDLAADIKAHGLLHPIALDEDGRLLDGRNRLRACELAGVEPQFETIGRHIDTLAFVVSANVKRRNLTAGQKAIAAAEAWRLAELNGQVHEHGGNRKSKAQIGHLIADPREHFAALFGVSKNYVQQARALITDDPIAAEAIKNGAPLVKAYERLQARQGSERNWRARLVKLRPIAPDLAELVEQERMPIEEAETLANAAIEECKKQRWAATRNIVDVVIAFDRPPECADDLAAEYDPAHAQGRGEQVTQQRLRNVAAFAAALAQAFKQRE